MTIAALRSYAEDLNGWSDYRGIIKVCDGRVILYANGESRDYIMEELRQMVPIGIDIYCMRLPFWRCWFKKVQVRLG